MKKKILVCGSMAYDSIMIFKDQFKNHIMPDQIHQLNVAFYVPEMKKNFGGTAGNIGYNLNLLGANFNIMATIGNDSDDYFAWLNQKGISKNYIKKLPNCYTAQAYITTDLDDNQITAFHPGAMSESHNFSIKDIHEPLDLVLISPDGKKGMVDHANECFELKIPFIFDPGQGLPMFNKEELKTFISKASYITVNDYESQMLANNSGLSIEEIASKVNALIITKGSEGSIIFEKGSKVAVPAFKVKDTIDPTGCGDAFRAGLSYGISKEWDLQKSAVLGSALASFKIKHNGGQNHAPSLAEIETVTGFKLNL